MMVQILLLFLDLTPSDTLQVNGVVIFIIHILPSWAKMMQNQNNKTVVWFCSLLEKVQGPYFIGFDSVSGGIHSNNE